MKINYQMVFALCLIFLGITPVYAETQSLDTILNDYAAYSPKERIERLEKSIETAPEQDKDLLRLLLTDARYEVAKYKIASEMLSMAESRAENLNDNGQGTFSKLNIKYDTLAILQSVPLAWLTTPERKRALALSLQIEKSLDATEVTASNKSVPSTTEESPHHTVDDAIAIVNEALEQARTEDLTLIAEAAPNGTIKASLEKCKSAREILMSMATELTDSSRERWEAAMLHLSKAARTLKQRQVLKYCLWAEGRYRESDPTNVSRHFNDQEGMVLYKRLSEVNVSLVEEPALAREITKRLYELYDRIDSEKMKERVRYDAIINLDKRRALENF